MGSAARGNIEGHPLDTTSFVGRRHQIAETKRLLSTSRLVTLTGGAGIGKTRLALRVAAHVQRAFPDGVWLVDLTDVRESEQVVHSVVASLGLREQAGGLPPLDLLAEYVARRRLLIVLDNCEHLVESVAALVQRLLRVAAGLRVLATSRESLAVDGEVLLAVPPLALPNSTGPLGRSEAVSLFVERAVAVLPSFRLDADNQSVVVEICRRLEGLPLGIELAAARLRDLRAEEIRDRLADQYEVLVREENGGAPRHQTLHSCITWSYDLCSPAECTLWARLSVFAGGFELDAVEGICAGGQILADDVVQVLNSLVVKSIVVCERPPGVVRYRLLEAIREFGRQRLVASGEEPALWRRHRDWFEELVLRAHAEWASSRQVGWFARLDREHSNVQAAMEYCLTERGEAESALRMLAPLYHFYCWGRGWYFEGRHWIDRALKLAERPSAAWATVLLRDACLAVSAGDFTTAAARLAEGRAVAELLGDPVVSATAEYADGLAAQYRGDLTDSIASFERGLALLPQSDNVPLRLDLLLGLAVSAGAGGDAELAISSHETTLALTEQVGESFHRSYALWALGLLAFQQGDIDRAADLQRQSLSLRQQLADVTGAGFSLEFLAWDEAAAEQHRRAATLLGAADHVWEITGLSLRAFGHLVSYHDECEGRCREALGDTSYEAAFQRGRDQGLDDAMRFALDEKPLTRAAREEPVLTRREWQVAELVAGGHSNKEIAASLVMSQRTAETHIQHILAKLGLVNRAQVAAWMTAQQKRVGS
jgi:predicted ATPase/DNA-binding CsgD family transcriptional regulator